jgi:peptide deformylase
LVLKLKYYPEDKEILQRRCDSILEWKEEHTRLAFDMVETVRHYDALGLAAPQVGWDARVIVVRLEAFDRIPIIMGNPFLHTWGGSLIEGAEGCLSFYSFRMKIMRHEMVGISYYDITRKETLRANLYQLDARVLQHEIDHLDGKLILDHAPSNLSRKLLLEKYLKQRKKKSDA